LLKRRQRKRLKRKPSKKRSRMHRTTSPLIPLTQMTPLMAPSKNPPLAPPIQPTLLARHQTRLTPLQQIQQTLSQISQLTRPLPSQTILLQVKLQEPPQVPHPRPPQAPPQKTMGNQTNPPLTIAKLRIPTQTKKLPNSKKTKKRKKSTMAHQDQSPLKQIDQR